MNNEFEILIITHGGCQDGTAAAWVVKQYVLPLDKKIRYVFGTKRKLVDDIAPLSIGDLKGKDIFITDYMYTYNELAQVGYKSLTIIDHHIGNAESECKKCISLPNTTVHHDIAYSGAGLAWKVLFGDDMPWWLQYIQDRDLWLFKLPYSKEVNDAMYNLKYRTFAKFDELNKFTPDEKESFIAKGREIGDVKTETIKAMISYAYPCVFDGYQIYAIETGVLISEVSQALYDTQSEFCDFVMCISYDFREKSFRCRLRSRKGSTNVSAIAEKYGGGGHENAAAFSYKGNIFEKLGDITI